jgi:adenylate cyclase
LKGKASSSILRGLTQRQRKKWDRAIEAFEKALSIYPDDNVAKHHVKQCQLLRHMDFPVDCSKRSQNILQLSLAT